MNRRWINETATDITRIGPATAARLADAGHDVYAAARREAELKELGAEHQGVRPIVLDVTDPGWIAKRLSG